MKRQIAKQRVEARYPGAYCCVNILLSGKAPKRNDYIVYSAKMKKLGSGKTERAAWINAARGIK